MVKSQGILYRKLSDNPEQCLLKMNGYTFRGSSSAIFIFDPLLVGDNSSELILSFNSRPYYTYSQTSLEASQVIVMRSNNLFFVEQIY